MAQKEKGPFLKWPWNWVVCGVFVVVGGYFIGYLWSGLLAALFLWVQKKRHPGAVPQGGYCLDRTRKRLTRLLWSLLYLLLAAGCGVVFFMGLQEDRTGWELKDWAVLIVSGGGTAVFAACCVYETVTDLRDAFFPAKSRLAKSIRSQLPKGSVIPPVEELFAMVDRDIQENGQWFDRVAIGNQWVLGDEVSSVPRIRGIFPRDEVKVNYSNGRRQSSRIVELYIVDDDRQVQCTALRSPDELKAAVTCLRLRTPEALVADHGKMSDFLGQTEREWLRMEQEFQARREKRLAEAEERERLRDRSGAVYTPPEEAPQPRQQVHARLSLSERTGVTRDYSSFTRRDVELAGEGLASGRYTAAAIFAGPRYLYIQAAEGPDGLFTVNASRPGPDKLWVFETQCSVRQAQDWLLQMSEGTFEPDLSGWRDITKKLEKEARKK